MKLLTLAAFAGAMLWNGVSYAADTYDVDPQHAWVSFTVNHSGWSNAHGIFKTVSGEIKFDKQDVTKSAVNIAIDTSSISTNFEQRDSDLQSPDFLNAAEFPQITFASTKVEKTGDKTGKVTGDMTIAGVTKPITLDVTWNAEAPLPWDAKTIKTGFTATGKFNVVEEFGIKKVAEYALGPDVVLNIDIEAIKK
jgi:polyisoprenoid-binding protein YceI